jgi:hypothetical protein
MSDLKEFLKQHYHECSKFNRPNVLVEDLGLFFWERGGMEHKDYCIKWFVPRVRKEDIDLVFDICLDNAKTNIEGSVNNRDMQDFLDCLACWGSAKLKEEIAKLSKE